jgi:hypothetical protein
VGEKRPGEPRGAVGLRPGGTANGEGGEGPPAPPAAAVAPTRSWVKEPWKGGDSASGKSGPGLASAKRDSTAERGGRDSAERGGPQRRAPSPTWRAAMGGGRTQQAWCRRSEGGAARFPSAEGRAGSLVPLAWAREGGGPENVVKREVVAHVDSLALPHNEG